MRVVGWLVGEENEMRTKGRRDGCKMKESALSGFPGID